MLSTRWTVALLGAMALAALLIQGGLFVQKTWLWTGDTIYHRAVMAGVQAGELLPGGPYAGLPAFYSPLFHYMAAAIGSLARIELTEAIRVISILFAPLTPLAAYWLARVLGPGSRLGAGRRVLLDVRRAPSRPPKTGSGSMRCSSGSTTSSRSSRATSPSCCCRSGWAASTAASWTAGGRAASLAGLAFGLMILAHTQTAVFAAPLIAIYLGAGAAAAARPASDGSSASERRHQRGRARRLGVLVGLADRDDRPERLVRRQRCRPTACRSSSRSKSSRPSSGCSWCWRRIGLFLVGRRLLRERSLAALLLLVWFLVPVLLAIFRPTGFPGGDTFFPRRLWQFASQPLMLMAGLGLVVGLLRPLRPRWTLVCRGAGRRLPGRVGAGLDRHAQIASPSSGTSRSSADQRWELDGNFALGPFLAAEGRRDGLSTVLAPTPEATLVWYYAGQKVVYLHPTAAIKLAYDVQRMTGFGEAERAADLVKAYGGDPTALTGVAEKYGARYVVLKRLGDRLAGIDVPGRRPRVADRSPGHRPDRRDEPLRVPGRLAERQRDVRGLEPDRPGRRRWCCGRSGAIAPRRRSGRSR